MELLTYTFIQHAFIGGALLALLAGALGPFVVQGRQAVASDMFAHVALAGIGGALLLGVSPWWGALPTLLLVSTVLWYLLETDSYSPDALAMFFLSGGLAVALALVHLAQDTTFAFETYLFGSILTLTPADLYAIAAAAAVTLVTLWYVWYPLLGAIQQPAYHLPYSNTPKRLRLVYLWILAVVVWVGIKTIGGLLIGALLVIPTLVVRTWCQSFLQTTMWSTAVALFATTAGLFIALFVDIPPSSLIIGMLLLLFLLQAILKKL